MDHSTQHTLLAIFLIFAAAKIMAEIFERLHQPGMVGEILAGVILGPGVLHWVQPSDALKTLAELGVMFLLFRVGLEVKASELMRIGGRAMSVAALGVILPFALGWAVMSWWGEPRIESLFVAAAMVATSVGITAQVLTSKGWLDHRASRIILAAAVIDDVLGLIVLAMVSSVAQGSINVVQIVMTAAAAVAFTLIAATWGTKALITLIPRFEKWLRAGEVQFNLAIIVLFGLALLGTYAGVAAIIGAFLAGMALSESLDRRVRDLSLGVSELLAPFFLAEIGLHLDIAAFASADTLFLSGLILIAAIVSKMAGGALGAWGLGWRDALRIGSGMTPRGEVGMIVAQFGLTAGVISDRVYVVLIFMAAVTTIAAPALLNVAFRGVGSSPALEPEREESVAIRG